MTWLFKLWQEHYLLQRLNIKQLITLIYLI